MQNRALRLANQRDALQSYSRNRLNLTYARRKFNNLFSNSYISRYKGLVTFLLLAISSSKCIFSKNKSFGSCLFRWKNRKEWQIKCTVFVGTLSYAMFEFRLRFSWHNESISMVQHQWSSWIILAILMLKIDCRAFTQWDS